MSNKITPEETKELLNILQFRFEKNKKRHEMIDWSAVLIKLEASPSKLWSLNQMEQTGGEPDVIGHDKTTDEYLFCDCAPESPKGRRSLCYDRKALDARKEHKPSDNALDTANRMGITILNEEQYKNLQQLGTFDAKTSSWIETPDEIRKLEGALFGDFRYNHVFIYHNGASSYYAARGFRGILKV